MALSNQFQNEITRIITLAEETLRIRYDMELLIARWNQNDMFNQLNDPDIQAITGFGHLTVSEVANAISAFTSILGALGDNTSGQAVNLIKMKG